MNAYTGDSFQEHPHPPNDFREPGLFLFTKETAPRAPAVMAELFPHAPAERSARERIAQLEATVAHLKRALKDTETQRDELREQSVRDPLTALFNRRYMEQTLEHEVTRARRFHTRLAFLILDVDNFKHLNDRFGHVAGDTVLREVGRLILANIRLGDVACRYGGDEFIVVMPETSVETAARRGEQVREQVRQLRLEFENARAPEISLSMGVAALPEHGGSGMELLKGADAALYRAKRCARGELVPSPPVD